MAKLIAVCGATGQLGGSVAKRMLKEGWKVRAITRNVESKAARALQGQGAEVITADYDDESSLIQAFDGAHAIFGMTNFWEHLMSLGADGAGKKEHQQSLNIASAASKTTSLEHFVFQNASKAIATAVELVTTRSS